jgi:iron complex outermembrane receptor protein
MKKLLLILLILTFSTFSWAQSATGIKGLVTDSKTGQPMENVEVMVNPGNHGTTTTKEGKFEILGLAEGDYQLIIYRLGYIRINKTIHLKANTIASYNFPLDINIKELLAVEIVDDHIETHAYSKVTMKEADIEQHPVRDIGDFLREIPNIHAVRKGGANLDPVIRGFKFNQLNIQVDNGLRMEGGCPNRMDPTTSHVEAGDIEAIEVVKGPFALRYGPVMGGVVNMLTINPRPFDKFQVHVKANIGYESNWNGQRQHFTILGGGQKVFFSFTGNNANYGNYTDGDDNKVSSSFRKFGFTGKLGFAPAKNHRIILMYSEFYARDVMFPSLPMDERDDNTKLYSLDYSAHDLTESFKTLTFKAYLSHVDHTMDNLSRGFSDTAAVVSNIIADRMGYKLEGGFEIGDNSHLFVGTDMYRILKDGNRDKVMIGQPRPMMGKVPMKHEDLWNNAVIDNYGVFGEYRWNKHLWEVVGAARLDFNMASSDSISLMSMAKPPTDLMGIKAEDTESSYANFSASIGATRKLNENMSLGFSFGRGVRSPSMIERFIISLPVGNDNYEYIGNPSLKPEANNEFDLVYKYNNKGIGGFEVTGFYSIIQDYIGGVYLPPSVQKPLMKSVLGVKNFENLGGAKMYGFEFSYATPNKYKLRARLTAAMTSGTIDEVEVLEIDPNTGKVTGSHMAQNDNLGEIPPMEANLNVSYNFLNERIIPQFTFRYVAAQNNVSLAMQELTSESFTLLGLRVLYKHNANLTIVGGVNNMLDQAYYEHLNRRVLGTDRRIYEPGRSFYINLIFNI